MASKSPATAKTIITVTKPEITKQSENSGSRGVHIIIKNGLAYLPTQAKTTGMLTFLIDPVYTVKLDLSELVNAIEKVLSQGRISITEEKETLLYYQGKKGKHPLQIATASTSWSNLEKTSLSYSIQENKKEAKWLLFLHNPKKEGYNLLEFPRSTPIQDLVTTILEDMQKYPHIFLKDTKLI